MNSQISDLSLELNKDIPAATMTTSVDSAIYSAAGSRSASASPLPQAMSQSMMRYGQFPGKHMFSALPEDGVPSLETSCLDDFEWPSDVEKSWNSHSKLDSKSELHLSDGIATEPQSNNHKSRQHNNSAVKRKYDDDSVEDDPVPSKCPHSSAKCTPCSHCSMAIESMNQLTHLNTSLIAQTHNHYKSLKAFLKQSENINQQINIPQDKKVNRISLISNDSGCTQYDSAFETSITDKLNESFHSKDSNDLS